MQHTLAPLVEVTRGPLVEMVHMGAIAVVDSRGHLLASVGSPDLRTYWRSSAKPFQAMAIVTSGAADAFDLDDSDIAISCASHNGEPVHQAAVLKLLGKLGLGQELLKCGVHAPYDKETAADMAASGQKPTSLHANCSGKHSGMLATAKQMQAPLETYREIDHPVQQAILQIIAEMSGQAPAEVAMAADGCGVPSFGLSLRRMALSFARLAAPDDAPERLQGAARRVRNAMMAHPYNVAGKGRICTDLMQAMPGQVVAKSGAAGVYCVGLLPEVEGEPGLGLAIKVADGVGVAREASVVEALEQLGRLPRAVRDLLAHYHTQPVKNLAGDKLVGALRPVFTLGR